jgi:hypothetical protein
VLRPGPGRAGRPAGTLVTGRFAAPDPRQPGRTLTFPATDDLVADFLLKVLRDTPHVIAEAIHALRQVDGGRHAGRLKRLLWGRPELRGLAHAVQQELDGQQRPG